MTTFSKDVLRTNATEEIEKIGQSIKLALRKKMKRRGIVVGLSGGIDSSVTAAIAAKAIGTERVLGLLMPERDSDADTLRLSRLVADHISLTSIHEDITGILESVGFYNRYNEAVRRVIPEYGDGWKSKIVLPDDQDKKGYNIFSIIARKPDGSFVKSRLNHKAYLEIVAATNFKQRTRKMLEYYHADRLNFAVAGTPNRLEYDLGFFVKLGDGAADIKPIAHLYKTQVYQLASVLGIPQEIIDRPPSTDTYSLEQGQDEFYFKVSYDKMDLCLYALNHNIPAEDVAGEVDLTIDQVQLVFDDIIAKKSTTEYLHMAPLMVS
jgi:NAD+ synthase